jgi:hypothetical protein
MLVLTSDTVSTSQSESSTVQGRPNAIAAYLTKAWTSASTVVREINQEQTYQKPLAPTMNAYGFLNESPRSP